MNDAEIKKAFAHFDKNGDGSISLNELEAAMKELGQNPTKLELKLLMKEADADDSGTISFEEFKVYMMSPPKGRVAPEELKKQFGFFDVDGDGYITKYSMEGRLEEELFKISKELGLESGFTPEVIEQMFADADHNGDGKISFEEYMNAMV